MKVIHLSAECYPAAKTGGLGDVVGALPKYLQQCGVDASVMIPKYRTSWLQKQSFETIYSQHLQLADEKVSFSVQKVKTTALGFPLFVVDLPGYFNREGIYIDSQTSEGYSDEAERFIAFQRAALRWIDDRSELPDLIHCHDHHTALVPFMMTQCFRFKRLDPIPTVLTVHSAAYQGQYSYDKQQLLPSFDCHKLGLLDWDGQFNALAAGLKCCWQISTVSPTYMKELSQQSSGLEILFRQEQQKSQGILNGIDGQLWDPASDEMLEANYSIDTIERGKKENKDALCRQFGLASHHPVFSFIGRLVAEKGADLLPDLLSSIFQQNAEINFILLGTGAPELHRMLKEMESRFSSFMGLALEYNEVLAHLIYGGSDFLVMPSCIEPCGLNQLYAMRYGTIPVVRQTGGLKDTVADISESEGNGVVFAPFTSSAAREGVERAAALYHQKERFTLLRRKNMELNFSWNASAQAYINMYKTLINR